MFYFAAVLLTVSFYLIFKSFLDRNFMRIKGSLDTLKNEQEELKSLNQKLRDNNSILKTTLEKTVALYDITKQISESLDEDKVFLSFKEELKKYVDFKDLVFLKTDTDLAVYKDSIILPLDVDHVTMGYLVATGVSNDEIDKFSILVQQCILGLRRAMLYKQVQELSITDTLTGVFTRKHYLERLVEEIDYSRKFNYPFSLLMLDIDYFKKFNDHYGHLVGDAILKFISKLIKDNLRQVDLLCRYGGEEFSIILTNTDKEGGKLAAERIRNSVENGSIKVYDEELKVTISIGVAAFPGDGKNERILIEKADKALYRAKEKGRNQVSS